LRNEDPLRHVKHYLSIVDNIQADEVTRDTSRLRFFHFSLKGKVAEWLDRIPPTQIMTWDKLVSRFLDHFFLVPHYGIQKWLLVQIFHDNISRIDRKKLDQFTQFRFSSLTKEEGWNQIEEYILKKQKKDDEDKRLLSIFKQIHINLPFVEAMIHMLKGAKVLKDLLSHKEKLEKAASSVKLSEECSAIIQRSLSQKEGDLGSFTLPCLIGPLVVKNAMADLGASINLMPHSLFRRLRISKLKPTKMSIHC
ncbi:hypothetical protein Tco_0920773, partial [Tanacetum coccineum]